MHVKSHNGVVLLFGIAGLFFSLQGNATEPRCYENIHQFMLLKFGDNYSHDENLTNKRIPGTRLLMVTDKNPMINPPRYLFLTKENGQKVCLTLLAPLANDINFSTPLIAGIPRYITTSGGGQGAADLSIRYEWNAKRGTYEFRNCIRKFGLNRKKISCKKLFAEIN